MPVHDPGPHLVEALSTLLAQDGPRLAVVALDDCSTDGAQATLTRLAREDERLIVHLSYQRLGIPRAWNRVIALALDAAPRARFAGWAGDHDRWARGWLGALAAALDDCPDAALAVPLTRKIDTNGRTLGDDKRRLDTRALPHVLLYDRLVLSAVAIEGPVVQVDEYLWERRSFAKPIGTVLERERSSFWPEGAPLWARLPAVVQGGAALALQAARGVLAPGLPRRTAFRAAAIYVRETREHERRVKERRRRKKNKKKRTAR